MTETINNPFAGKLGPARISFRLEDQVVWGASVVQGEDGRYYMYASVWPTDRGTWVTDSLVVLASSDQPTGPYHYECDVLPPRGPGYWDGMMSHNPNIQTYGGRYYLFYTGTTYSQPRPTTKITDRADALYKEAWDNKRIGVAIAEDSYGPWQRLDAPIIEPRPGHWDSVITSNAAPAIHADGSVTLIYKSTSMEHPGPNTPPEDKELWDAMIVGVAAEDSDLARRARQERSRWLTLGVARAARPEGPYERVGDHDGLIHIEGEQRITEDAYAWTDGETYHMVTKTFDDTMIDEPQAGAYVWSRNGADWFYPQNGPKAYSRTIMWEDGTTTALNRLERPQVLVQEGVPAYLFVAANPGRGSVLNNGFPFNAVLPVARD